MIKGVIERFKRSAEKNPFLKTVLKTTLSRATFGCRVEESKSAQYSAELIDQSCQKQNVTKDQMSLHSDNGSPMKGATMLATLQRPGVTPSLSRPSVSHDNPFF